MSKGAGGADELIAESYEIEASSDLAAQYAAQADIQLRLECLKLAQADYWDKRIRSMDVVKRADAYFRFVKR